MRININAWFRRAPEPEPAPASAPAPIPAPAPVAPAAPARDVQERVVDSVAVTYMDSPIPEVNSAFGYGHLDGRRGVPPENFRGFIHHTVDGEGIERRLEELQADEQALRQRAADVRQRRAELAGGSEALRALREREEQARAALHETETRLAEAEQSLPERRDRGSWSQAVMFLAAGAVFVLGDVVMTRKIVADALSLTGHKFFGVLDESWVFATGLAMISIVLKPAYDRLVEKPYWKGTHKRFVWVICTLALCSFATLWVLGAFRSDAYRDQQRVLMVQQNDQLTPQQKIEEIRRIQDGMLGNKLASWSFVLSGILFAAAGAVTLSIGLHYARQVLHVRKPALREWKALQEAQLSARQHRAAATSELADQAQAMERLRALAIDDPPAVQLEAQADSVAEQRRELAALFIGARQQRLRHLYDDGYELGDLARRTADDETRRAAVAARPRRKRPRPFVALRRAIRERALTPETMN